MKIKETSTPRLTGYRLHRRAIAGLVAVAITPTAAAAAAAPTGDVAAITFYRQVQAAYKRVPGLRVIRRGYLSYAVAGSRFSYIAATAVPPVYHAAVETILYRMRNGRVTAYADTARAPGEPAVTIEENSSGVWATLDARRGRCYYRNPRSSGVASWSRSFVGVVGNFAPLSRDGRIVTIRSTFPWTPGGGSVTETDHFDASTKYWRFFSVDVSTHHPFTWSMSSFRELSRGPLLPRTHPRCSR